MVPDAEVSTGGRDNVATEEETTVPDDDDDDDVGTAKAVELSARSATSTRRVSESSFCASECAPLLSLPTGSRTSVNDE